MVMMMATIRTRLDPLVRVEIGQLVLIEGRHIGLRSPYWSWL